MTRAHLVAFMHAAVNSLGKANERRLVTVIVLHGLHGGGIMLRQSIYTCSRVPTRYINSKKKLTSCILRSTLLHQPRENRALATLASLSPSLG